MAPRDFYLGDELRDHDEAQALKILKRGLGVLGMKESDLEGKAKGALEKQVLAWWLRKKTVVSRKWVSEKLGMGDLSRVTSAVRISNRCPVQLGLSYLVCAVNPRSASTCPAARMTW